MTVHAGDCFDIMPTLDAESIDAIVTDPPYGLGFMGKAWDGDFRPADVPMCRNAQMDAVNAGASRQGERQRAGLGYQRRQARDSREYEAWCERWAVEALRVAKPGAHLLAFGGTRTYHRLACAIEDAGWEVRDTLCWGYAQGFPKSLNLDGERKGWGTALKPAWEPIILARKPLRGTVAANVEEYGTGALNIDGCRIGTVKDVPASLSRATGVDFFGSADGSLRREGGSGSGHDPNVGRWPANLILTDPIFDGDTPGVVGGGKASFNRGGIFGVQGIDQPDNTAAPFAVRKKGDGIFGYGDSGTYSRFFLVPKARRSDREPMGGGPTRIVSVWGGDEDDMTPGEKSTIPRANHHPTVKPTELMRHLVRLVTPPGGVVLDPFLGSGTTALACEMEGFGWVGIEKEAEYVAIAEARLSCLQRGLGL